MRAYLILLDQRESKNVSHERFLPITRKYFLFTGHYNESLIIDFMLPRLMPLNLTMALRWRKFGGVYTQYIIMLVFDVGVLTTYGTLLSQDDLWPSSNCCYESC